MPRQQPRRRSPAGFDWGDLRYFLAVARGGTLTAAAAKLGTDHTTVGRRIRALERTLQAKLFERALSGYRLTVQGSHFLAATEAMEREALAAEARIRGADLTLSGCVRIGATDGFGTFFLAPRLGRLRQAYPELEIELMAMPRVFSLSKREADIAIGLAQPAEGRLFSQKLTDYELGIYGSKQYLTGRPDIATVADLAGHPFISYIDDALYAKELNYLPRVGAGVTAGLRISNPIAQLEATLSGYGLCVLPCFIATREERLSRVLPKTVALKNAFWLIMHADQRELARLRVVATFIQDAIKAERATFFAPP